MKRNTKECPICHKNISLSNYRRHIQKHENVKNVVNAGDISLVCRYCGRTLSRLCSLRKHERYCQQNPDREIHPSSWTKGQTKYNNEVLARVSQKLSNRLKSGDIRGSYGRKGSDNYSCRPEVRSKISEAMMGNHNNDPSKTGRGKKGWYKGFFCSSTYELAYVIYCLDHGVNIQKCDKYYTYNYKGKQHRYYPDFIVNGEIVEIKGFWTEVVDVKTASVSDLPIKVLYHKDLEYVFKYIEDTYNKRVDRNLHELYEMGS